jgi:hypothetical protein
MRLDSIFKVFSRRSPSPKARDKALTPEFRTRIIMLCRDTLSGAKSEYPRGDYTQEFWSYVHTKLQYLHGRPRLSNSNVASQAEDALTFLSKCNDAHFLDFVEMIFQFEWLWKACPNEKELVEDVNRLFEVDDLPYALTNFVREKGLERLFGRGQETEVTRTVAYPQVIRKDSQVEHAMAIEPALSLLRDASFTSSNGEFLEALADYRKGDYGDCLVKCGSSFESVMKIICHRKGWPYQQSDTASMLLRTIIPRTNLDPFFEQPLLVIATIRNRLSKGHGAGTQQRDVPRHVARFAINATAAAILLLVEETSQ